MSTFLHSTSAAITSTDEEQDSSASSSNSSDAPVTGGTVKVAITDTASEELQTSTQDHFDDTAAIVEHSTELTSPASRADEMDQQIQHQTVLLSTYSMDPAEWGNVTNDVLEYFSHFPIRRDP